MVDKTQNTNQLTNQTILASEIIAIISPPFSVHFWVTLTVWNANKLREAKVRHFRFALHIQSVRVVHAGNVAHVKQRTPLNFAMILSKQTNKQKHTNTDPYFVRGENALKHRGC